MHCSTCGASVPAGRPVCGTCGTPVQKDYGTSSFLGEAGKRGAGEAPLSRAHAVASAIGICPRCAYEGQGLPYFTRGPHMAALVGATMFTLPYALGAGGLLYYGLRRDHRICPRCGKGWGRYGEEALTDHSTSPSGSKPAAARGANEGIQRTWSILLFVLAAIMLAVGAIEFEALVFTLGVFAAVGGIVLHRGANRAREERRAALISSLQTPVLKLAAERAGRLTVTDVAAHLGWPLRRAEKVLHSLDDGWRVNSDVTDEGVIVYEFRELMLPRGDSSVDSG